ncbi:hypothetical protein HN827_10255 [archaeon]|nr:hypothetical protein [archaeon]
MIFGLTILVLVPTVIMFKNFAFSSGDEVVAQRIKEISLKIIDTAREVHYYGPPSKKVLTLDMPPNVLSMGIIHAKGNDVSNPDDDEYVLAFELVSSDGNYNLYYDSEIPIFVEKLEECSPLTSLHSECGPNFECICFEDVEFTQGIKEFNVESTSDSDICGTVDYCVKINEISEELSES